MAETEQPTVEESSSDTLDREIWQYITPEQLEEYKKLQSEPDAAAAHIAGVLNLPEYRFDSRSAIKLDYLTGVLEFAYDMCFAPTRISSVLNLSQAILQACEGGASFDDCQACLKANLLALCTSRPTTDGPTFSPDQIDKIGHFFARTFFRHYRMYSYIFSHEQELTQYSADLLIEYPLLPSLHDALSEDEWVAYQEAEKKAAEDAIKAAEEAEIARQKAEEEAAESAAEAAREAARQEELAKKPATLDEAIKHLVAVRLEEEKAVLAASYKTREDELLHKLSDLEKMVVKP